MEKDYYAELGVAKDASQKEIKKAFRTLARELAPEVRTNAVMPVDVPEHLVLGEEE